MTKFGFAKQFMFGAALAASLAACAGEGEVDGVDVDVDVEEIIGGFPANSPKLNAVGSIGAKGDFDGDGVDENYWWCSGTLISPTMVLTAEHCVQGYETFPQLAFHIGPDATNPVRTVFAAGAVSETTFYGGFLGLGADVAIVHLAEPVTDVTPFAYAELTDDKIGRRFAGLGYGVQDANGSSGTRRVGSMKLQFTGGKVFENIFGTYENFVAVAAPRLFPGADEATLQWYYDAAELQTGVEAWFGNGPGDAQACFGDSGGPITLNQGGRNTVFGVTSWGFDENGLCTFGGAYATLNPTTIDFIDYETSCALIDRAGECNGPDTVVRCAGLDEGGYRPLETSCAEIGMFCGEDATGELGCTDSCAHEITAEGIKLRPWCDSCVADICEIDSYCCEYAWDAICVEETASICGLDGPEAPPAAIEAARAKRAVLAD